MGDWGSLPVRVISKRPPTPVRSLSRWRGFQGVGEKEMMKPGLTLYQQSKPLIMSLNVDDSSLEVNMLNQKIGKWEF